MFVVVVLLLDLLESPASVHDHFNISVLNVIVEYLLVPAAG